MFLLINLEESTYLTLLNALFDEKFLETTIFIAKFWWQNSKKRGRDDVKEVSSTSWATNTGEFRPKFSCHEEQDKPSLSEVTAKINLPEYGPNYDFDLRLSATPRVLKDTLI